MSEVSQRRFRLCLCRMVFAELEVVADGPVAAEVLGRSGNGATVKFETGPIVHRIEQQFPIAGKPGEFQWVEVQRP